MATAQNAAPSVPVEQASFHVPVFSNEHVTVLNVLIPPQRTSGYHRHSLDSVGVLISDAARTGQVLGADATVTAPRERGSANFTGYAREPLAHTVTVTGDTPFHNIVVELLDPAPGRFMPGTRGRGYTQILDNERVRIWRLVLDPGQTAPPITQAGTRRSRRHRRRRNRRERDRQSGPNKAPRSGEFYWQDADAGRRGPCATSGRRASISSRWS